MFHRILRGFFKAAFPLPARSLRHSRARLRLEPLEHRLVPANVWTVNLIADTNTGNLADHTGDLRYCITNAASGDTINFSPNVFTNAGTTITLAKGEIAFGTSLTIANQTGNSITVDAQGKSRIFDISGAKTTETISSLAFINGSAPDKTEPKAGDGGAIYDQGTLTLISDTFSKDSAAFGGAVYNVDSGVVGSLKVQGPNSTFRTDTAVIAGGAIYVGIGVGNNVVLNNTGFTNNTGGSSGGAVAAFGAATTTMQVTACSFTTNTSDGDGGAIETGDQLTVSCPTTGPQTTFTSNSAAKGGAIAYEPVENSASNMTLTNVTFTSNTAGAGGAVYSYINTQTGTVNATITGSLFNGNQAKLEGATNNGGGLYEKAFTTGTGAASLKVTNSTFYNNSSESNGGGLAINLVNSGTGNNNATLTSLTIYQNQAATSGGGLYANLPKSTVSPTLTLDNSIIAGNSVENPPSEGPDIYLNLSGVPNDFTSKGYNFIGVGDNGTGMNAYNWSSNDILGTAANPKVPALDPTGLQSNGGPTQTLKLLTTAGGGYQVGDPTLAGTTDQRGYTRKNTPPTAEVSIGAYDPDATAP